MGSGKPKSDAIDVSCEEPIYQQLARFLRQQILYAGIQDMAHEMGYDLKKDVEVDPVRIPLSSYVPPQPSQAGGVILYGIYNEQYIGMFRSEHIPLVVVDYWTQDLVTDCVTNDVESEACQVVDLLVQRGHVSLGFMGHGRLARDESDHEYDPDIYRMIDSLRRAARRRQLEFRDEWVLLVPGPFQQEQAVRDYLSMRPRPTALFCFTDSATAVVLKILADMSLRCPEDISIISRVTEQVAGRRITSMVGSPEEMGRAAVQLLAGRMHGLRTHPVKLALPPRLVFGDSVGPPPPR